MCAPHHYSKREPTAAAAENEAEMNGVAQNGEHQREKERFKTQESLDYESVCWQL